MSIARLSVERPVTFIMLFSAIILLGLISWARLPQELFPSISYPQITVVTSYSNAAPEEIENLVTKIIEEATGTVNKVKRITSVSKEGLSLVMVEFDWGTNMDFAALNVREKIDLVKEKLPRESGEPIVMKYNPFDLPVLNLAVTGPKPPYAPLSSKDLREVCRKYIKDGLEKVEGVASATITGGDEREILVEIDQPRLLASQISIVSVVDSLKTANINYPAGTIKESFYEYLIRTMGEFQKVEEIKETPAALDQPELEAKTQDEKEKKEKQGHRLVYLKDIAKVKDTIKEVTSISRYNGKSSVSLVVRKQSGTNTVNVVKGARKEIKKLLEEKLPKGMSIQVTYDQSQFIKEALSNVRDAGFQGGVLSFIILFLFLWELKSSLIIIVAIPICVTATAMLMYFGKINLNIMSLGGLAMGVGMVVDNANIVIENIFRHRQMGKKNRDAIIDATSEMIPPIFGSTLTNIAVFFPFGFVVGIAGQVFKQLSFTISFSLVASIFVAITLVPILAAVVKESRRDERLMAKVESTTNTYISMFSAKLASLLDKKNQVIGVILLLFALSTLILLNLERQFLPRVDQRQFIIKADLPPGSRLEVTDSVVRKLENLLLKLPETKDVTVNIGSSEERTSAEETALQTLGTHQAQLLVNLKKKSWKDRIYRSTEDVIQYLKNAMDKEDLEGGELEYIAQDTSFGSALEQGAPIAIEIKGPDLAVLSDIAGTLQSHLRKEPGTFGVKTNMPAPSPETKLHILKDKASLFGLSVRDIALTAQVALKGYVATKFKVKQGEEDVDIRVRLRPDDRKDLSNLRRMLIHSPLGMNIAMSDVAFLTRGTGPTEIKRIDQQRSIIVTANAYSRNLKQALAQTNRLIASVKAGLGKDYVLELGGEQRRMRESFQSLAFALILAFALVYMIMAAEFESLWQPFLIMFTIPLSLIGVTAGLILTNTPLSAVAYLGIIMLGGIAVNNGIVLIEFVNELRKQGYSPRDAVLEASKARLRPILMTSLTTILGLLPLAMGLGEGAELQKPLAITVMGGLTSSTFLTLVFIPALYLFVVERFEPQLAAMEIKPLEAGEATLSETPPTPEQTRPSETPARPGLPTPLEVELTRMQKPLPPEAAPKERPRAEKPEHKPELPVVKIELNARQQQLLERLKIAKKITRKEYAETFAISIPTASRDLKELVDKKLLRARGPLGPGRWYELF